MSSESRGLFKARLLRNDSLSPTCHLLTFERPEGFPDSLPAQFVSVRVSDTVVPLLRRPYSIMDLTEDTLSLLVKVVGAGSSMLACKRPKVVVDLIGPLGCVPFPGPEEEGVLFVAGGTGLAPIIFAARTWRRGGYAQDLCLLYGAGTEEELLVELVEDDFSECHFATLDGSAGHHGDVVSLCGNLLNRKLIRARYLISCGPRGMVRALVALVGQHFKEHYTSLESVMACGLGACRGCTVPVYSSEGTLFRAICSDGTVFRAGDIAWEEWEE